jgi:cobalamin biosynthesis Co2+ chelatase CbiK
VGYIISFHFSLAGYSNTYDVYKAYMSLVNRSIMGVMVDIFMEYNIFYLCAIMEELVFRGPLVYYHNGYTMALSVILYTMQCYESNKTLFYNIVYMTHAAILSICLVNVGLKQAILLHIMDNILASVRGYPHKQMDIVAKVVAGGMKSE